MKKTLMLIIAMCIIFLAGCGSNKIEGALEYEVKDFSYVNQDNQKLGLQDLKGDVWIADFIFTNCETVCPPMTAHMAKLQQMLKDEGISAQLVSFSVDPEYDTPELLKKYAGKFDADFSNWNFLTGYSQNEIEIFAKESFLTMVQKPDNEDQVIHSTSFYLVDQNGVVMKSYSGVENPPYDEIIEDIKTLNK